MSRVIGLAGLVAVLWQLACAATVSGVVYVDRNHDRIRQPDEVGAADVVVMLDRGHTVRTDARGRYTFLVPAALGAVWARVPDGFRPGLVWATADRGTNVDLPLVPIPAADLTAPLTFVVAADTHAVADSSQPWNGGDLADAFHQALGLATPPRFFTIVGDITQRNDVAEFAKVEAALAGVPGGIPFVAVPGNHDWYDGGVTWRGRWGPDNYSFDTGNLHVVVWDTNLTEDDQLQFFANDLANVDPSSVVVALGHAPPSDAVATQLAALGVDYMFTGHWHANRRVDRPGLVEWGTQNLVMGTIDQTPSGYRVVTFLDGVPTVEHRARVIRPHVAVSSPHAGSCAPDGGFRLLVSAALDVSQPDVRARVDCGAEIPLAWRGGWSFAGDVGPLSRGFHRIDVRATSHSGRRAESTLAFEVCAKQSHARFLADWPQLGGHPAHAGATAAPISPPLSQQWATSIWTDGDTPAAPAGGHLVLGTPVIKGNTIVVGAWDLGAGNRGGLVAIALSDGATSWRYRTASAVRASPAIGTIDGEDVVVAALENGEVHAVSLATGRKKWSYNAAAGLDHLASSLWAPPTIDGDTVYIGVQGRTSAIALRDGKPRWTREHAPAYAWLGSPAAIAVADGTAVAVYAREEGVMAWDTKTGDLRWKLSGAPTIGVHATPVIANGEVYLINGSGVVSAVELATSRIRWSKQITPDTNEWSYAITATPALAGGILVVPTQLGELVALDVATGEIVWRRETAVGPLNFTHYRAAQAGFPASPVITGNIVWVPHPDGTLAAVALASGKELWKTNLGAPIVSAPAPAGEYLVVATFDGTVRAFAPGPAMAPPKVATCPPTYDPYVAAVAGCRSADEPAATALLAFGVLLALRLGGRPRRGDQNWK